jgi:hypothetical protein
VTPTEKLEAIAILRDEAKRKLDYIKSLGSRDDAVIRAYRKDLADTLQAMETLRDEVEAE